MKNERKNSNSTIKKQQEQFYIQSIYYTVHLDKSVILEFKHSSLNIHKSRKKRRRKEKKREQKKKKKKRETCEK